MDANVLTGKRVEEGGDDGGKVLGEYGLGVLKHENGKVRNVY